MAANAQLQTFATRLISSSMSMDAPQQEQIVSDLRAVTAKLRASILEGRLTGSELILGCRQVLDLWVKGGGSSLDDPIIGFTGIESQSDHVLGGSQVRVGRDVDRMRFKPGSIAEEQEVEEIGRFFDESFRRNVEELAGHLDGR
jgi:hypothetical protein